MVFPLDFLCIFSLAFNIWPRSYSNWIWLYSSNSPLACLIYLKVACYSVGCDFWTLLVFYSLKQRISREDEVWVYFWKMRQRNHKVEKVQELSRIWLSHDFVWKILNARSRIRLHSASSRQPLNIPNRGTPSSDLIFCDALVATWGHLSPRRRGNIRCSWSNRKLLW
jgi:hypothetical protein